MSAVESNLADAKTSKKITKDYIPKNHRLGARK